MNLMDFDYLWEPLPSAIGYLTAMLALLAGALKKFRGVITEVLKIAGLVLPKKMPA